MKKMILILIILLVFSSITFAAEDDIKAIAILKPTRGNTTGGNVFFVQTSEGIRLSGEIRNLSPGWHGIHIHEKGDCGGAESDAKSAGDHFNPVGKEHGAKDADNRHAGDLGNLIADSDGKATIDAKDKVLTLTGKDSILGRSIIVHEKKDDLKTQPAGDSGARLACGIIKLSH